jgi:hypothetical protein
VAIMRQLNRRRLRFARARAYIGDMNWDYWITKLREAEQELDAARRRSEVDAAASKLQYAKAQLRALEQSAKTPSRRTNRGSRSAGASS